MKFFPKSMFRSVARMIPESSFKAFDIEYPSIVDFQVYNGIVYFTQTNCVSGKNHLFMKKPDGLCQKLHNEDHDIKSGLNCYGAASLAVVGGTDNSLLALSKNVLYLFNENGYQTQVTLPDGDYGDLIVGGKYVYMIYDDHKRQAVIQYDIQSLFNGSQILPKIVNSEPDYFYGNLDLSPGNRFISFNRWINGTPFDDASLFIFDIVSWKPLPTYATERAIKYPRWRFKKDTYEVVFITDKNNYDEFCVFDTKTLTKRDCHYHESAGDDIGDPNWIMGRQWPFVSVDDSVVFSTIDKLFIYKGAEAKKNALSIDNITLMHFDKKYPNMVYMKTAGPVSNSIMCLDINVDEIRKPKIVYETECVSPESIFIPKLVEYGSIKGYEYTPQFNVEKGSRKIIIWLHGGPAMRISPAFDIRKQAFIAAGYHIFMPAYSGSGGYGFILRDRLNGNWGKADAEDIIKVTNVIKEPGDKVYLVGSSAGAFLAYYSIARAEEGTFTAASVVASFYDFEDAYKTAVPFEAPYLLKLLPSDRLNIPEKLIEKKVPIAIFHGEKDPVVSPTDAHNLAIKLAENGVIAPFKEFEGEGHGIKKKDNIICWLQKTVEIFTCK